MHNLLPRASRQRHDDDDVGSTRAETCRLRPCPDCSGLCRATRRGTGQKLRREPPHRLHTKSDSATGRIMHFGPNIIEPNVSLWAKVKMAAMGMYICLVP